MIISNFDLKKKEIADRMISRAESGFYFLEDFLRDKHGGTDAVFSRSLYILLSYNSELILKSWLVLNSTTSNIDDLEKELKNSLHDFEKISGKFAGNGLSDIGIKSITMTKQKSFIEYIVETSDDSKVLVQDFTNVRYDFISDDLRNIDGYEMDRMKTEIESLLQVIKVIRTKASVVKGMNRMR